MRLETVARIERVDKIQERDACNASLQKHRQQNKVAVKGSLFNVLFVALCSFRVLRVTCGELLLIEMFINTFFQRK